MLSAALRSVLQPAREFWFFVVFAHDRRTSSGEKILKSQIDTEKLKCACAKETLLTILNKSTQKHHLALQNCDDFDFRINRHWIV